jgi:hypothetical protein
MQCRKIDSCYANDLRQLEKLFIRAPVTETYQTLANEINITNDTTTTFIKCNFLHRDNW